MSELRDQIAQILYERAKPQYLREDTAAVLADEVIRQMEWARRGVSISGPTVSTSRLDGPLVAIIAPATVHLGDLTLAPPEWKP